MTRGPHIPVLLAAILSLFASVGFSQQTAPRLKTPSQEARDKISVETNLVVLSVTVKDARGNLVSGLAERDFQVFEDSVRQKIVAFTDEGLPLSLLILVDAGMNSKEGEPMAKSLRAIVGGISDTDEAMVCHYDTLFYPGDSFSTSYAAILADLKSTQSSAEPSPQYIPSPLITGTSSTSGPPVLAAPTYAGHRPSKALDDALYSSAELLAARPAGRRRVILLISDGVNEPKLNHHPHREVLDFLLQHNVSVYTLAVGSVSAKHKFSDLSEYSSETGGDLFFATQTTQMEILYSRITEQARHDYTLAYYPPPPVPDSSSSSPSPSSSFSPAFRSIRVSLSNPSLTVSTRSGYFPSVPTSSTPP